MTLNYHLQGPNVVNYHATQEDIDCLFGDMDGSVEPIVVMNVNCLRWDEIAVECKFFSSKGQARKNGWDGFVPRGFGQRKFGKQGKGVWYFNPISFEEQLNNQAAEYMDEQTNKMIDSMVIHSIMNYQDGDEQCSIVR